jgi:hypothetical protein
MSMLSKVWHNPCKNQILHQITQIITSSNNILTLNYSLQIKTKIKKSLFYNNFKNEPLKLNLYLKGLDIRIFILNHSKTINYVNYHVIGWDVRNFKPLQSQQIIHVRSLRYIYYLH